MNSSTVIRKLFDHKKAINTTASVAYFFFDFTDEARQVVDIMLRSIILQLSAQSPNHYTAPEYLYASSNGQTLSTYEDLLLVLDMLILEIDHTYIILNALDECIEPDLLVQLISRFQNQNRGPLHLLLTGQPREIFTAAFQDVPRIGLGFKNTRDDIEFFVVTELKSKRLKHWERHTAIIISKILEKSDGM
jgi:hypothetical protein